jgi:hypothetical protein
MEPAFLRIGSGTVRSELTHFAGQRGVGAYRLTFSLEWSPTNYDELEGAKLLVGGDLEVSFAQDAPAPLAQLQAIYAMAFPTRAHGTSARIDLGANLTAAQVEAIERERGGGPIKLHFKLQGGARHEPMATPASWLCAVDAAERMPRASRRLLEAGR